VADAALNPHDTGVAAEILRLTDGRGVDVAFEAAGAPDTPQQAAAVARIGGKVIVAGIPASEDSMTVTASTVRKKGLTIKLVRRMKHTYPRAIRLVQAGLVDVKPLVTHCFPLEGIAEAFELVAGYQDGILKAVIEI
jgi:L-iditol 2-dehydrogenase